MIGVRGGNQVGDIVAVDVADRRDAALFMKLSGALMVFAAVAA
jgi:hypothetical protein